MQSDRPRALLRDREAHPVTPRTLSPVPTPSPVSRATAATPPALATRAAAVALALATVLVVAGCSRGDDQAAPSVTAPTTPSSTTTTPPPPPTTPQTTAVPLITAANDSVTSVPEPEQTVESDIDLELPALGITAPVIESGVTQDLVLQVPSDPAVLGRWADGARPGDGRGSVVLAGHVSYRGELGVLHTLQNLEPGDEAVVETPSGPITYVTDRVDVYRKTALPYEEIFQFDVPERLVLITCGGKFDRSTGHYDSNVVAYLSRA
jgi:hypothetical protein